MTLNTTDYLIKVDVARGSTPEALHAFYGNDYPLID
jgi:hypothetical protein